jgi:hypothetical protein
MEMTRYHIKCVDETLGDQLWDDFLVLGPMFPEKHKVEPMNRWVRVYPIAGDESTLLVYPSSLAEGWPDSLREGEKKPSFNY